MKRGKLTEVQGCRAMPWYGGQFLLPQSQQGNIILLLNGPSKSILTLFLFLSFLRLVISTLLVV